AVTESNNVYALDAVDGSIIWQINVGTPVSLSDLACPWDVDPIGITGTPVIDLGSRSLFFDAMTTPDGGETKKHLIFSLHLRYKLNGPRSASSIIFFMCLMAVSSIAAFIMAGL
ncbi:MAG: hypothetical protein DMF31_11115, partial [Verrucomicrobia bacterium]